MQKSLTGGCQCGAVRYECTAEPAVSLICHCRHCQRASGTGCVPLIAVPKDALTIAGAARYFETTSDGGRKVRRGFCPTCGSRVFAATDSAPDLITILAGSLDDPSRFQPSMHVYTDSAHAWDRIADGLPSFARMPSQVPAQQGNERRP